METKMETKLTELLNNGLLDKYYIGLETGLMVNEHQDVAAFMILQYDGNFHMYLHLWDDDEPPFRDILVEGIAPTLEEAQEIAVANLDKMAYEGNIHSLHKKQPF